VNLWLRLLWLLLTVRFRAPIRSPLETSVLTLRVLPNDIDVYGHMNNGRYFAMMDLGRMDLFLRSGLARAIRGAGWTPILGAAAARFRRELRVFRRFRLETRLVCWEGTTFVTEQRLVIRDARGREVVAASALMRGGLYDWKARAFVPVAELFRRMNVDAVSPPTPPEARAFLDAETAMKLATPPARS
jgi:acyl-CoA thioesterase FadM